MLQSEKLLSVNHVSLTCLFVKYLKMADHLSLVVFVKANIAMHIAHTWGHPYVLNPDIVTNPFCANDSSKLWFFLRIAVLLLSQLAIFSWWVIKVVTWPASNHTEHPHSNNMVTLSIIKIKQHCISPHKIQICCLSKDPSICSFRRIDELENLLFKFVLYFWIFHPSFKGSDISRL